ncbi:MAG TPA: LamG domain-containing protein, partial [Candidatus Marinimicrobia bacterium]|nr:LamG domain-containing protein [Candidatus Neomarinimicrobiota bacterium]
FMNFRHAYNFELKNLHFFAGSIDIRGSYPGSSNPLSGWTIEDSKFSHSYYHGHGRTQRTNHVRGDNVTFRNTIFEHINDGVPLNTAGKEQTFENILVRHIDWYMGSSNYLDEGSPSYFRYVTFENSYSGGIFSNAGSLVEYARFENLYDGCDCSGIQRNANNTMYSTTRYTWIINAPGLKGMRFDSSCGGNNGDIYNVVSIGNHRGFRLKGDYHDVYHVTAYDNERQDISMPQYKFCGLDGASGGPTGHRGNWNSNLYNSIAEGSLECTSRLCRPGGINPWTETVEIDGQTLDWIHFSNLERAGIWFGRSMSVDKNDVPNFSPPWPSPHFEMQAPW